ncbi:MAG: prepilin-type N-terminal cleavage/methylation domain-containing protein [Leptolyngbya sp. PLA1]|nr:prepilin-type N-terminal cleavage/methylation domain-containing protein [Leptolyngbya sp. PLA1]
MVRADTRHTRPRPTGFTLVELVVVVGVVAMLVSFFIPALAKAAESGRRTQDAATARQNVALVAMYASDHKDMHPIAADRAFAAALRWYEPLVTGGYVNVAADVDPRISRKNGGITMVLSVCMTLDPEMMIPGRTMPPTVARATGVRMTSIPYPSSKGQIIKASSDGTTPQEGGRYYCCAGPPWKTAIAMCDGSAVTADAWELNGGLPPLIIDQVGSPAYSSWGGFLARDR